MSTVTDFMVAFTKMDESEINALTEEQVELMSTVIGGLSRILILRLGELRAWRAIREDLDNGR
jgi:hypothetical protein